MDINRFFPCLDFYFWYLAICFSFQVAQVQRLWPRFLWSPAHRLITIATRQQKRYLFHVDKKSKRFVESTGRFRHIEEFAPSLVFCLVLQRPPRRLCRRPIHRFWVGDFLWDPKKSACCYNSLRSVYWWKIRGIFAEEYFFYWAALLLIFLFWRLLIAFAMSDVPSFFKVFAKTSMYYFVWSAHVCFVNDVCKLQTWHVLLRWQQKTIDLDLD